MSDFLLGGTYPTSIKLGNTTVSKLMMGSVQVWPRIVGGFGRLYNWFSTQPQWRKVKYGYLYNWYVAINVKNIANTGWHGPTYGESNTLLNHLGGLTIAGGKLKEVGFTYWNSPNTGATNEVGFNMKPAGFRLYGNFNGVQAYGYWWDTEVGTDPGSAYAVLVKHDLESVTHLGAVKEDGLSIRLLKDSTTLTNGQTGTYTGNDGRVYPTICIGAQEWISSNLAETKYRDGSLIPRVTDNATWAALATGAMCAYNNDEANVFETSSITASIAPVGWHVPTNAEVTTLSTNATGAQLKEVGLVHWETPNTGATNSTGFNGVGAGKRLNTGVFTWLKIVNYFWSNVEYDYGTTGLVTLLAYNSDTLTPAAGTLPKTEGVSLRFVKNDSLWTAGDTLTDIDGNIYPTVKIGAQVWTAANWKCTKYNDGTPIPNVTDNAAWAALTTGAQCSYNNDNANI